MKMFLGMILVFGSFAASAVPVNFEKKMPDWCVNRLYANAVIRDGSGSSSPQDIIEGLKFDWKKNPRKAVASYDDCGSSDFYYVVVDKASCTIVESGGGDSDGECN